MGDQIEKVIEVKNVKKIYRMGSEKIFAVDDVSFEILKGEFCCLLGTSGSGKSTLLNLMAGIEKLTGGQIIIKSKKIHRMNENSLARFRQRYLGFVFQSYNLMGSMTALENVEFPLVFKRVKANKRKKMARDMLIKVGLGSRLSHKPKEMSGGQQQRVGIARAFVANPEIVFADEPTGNLDTKTAMEVMKLIKIIAKENNQTIVMVTHDKRLADFADRTIHILDGRIQDIELKRNRDKKEIINESITIDNEEEVKTENEPQGNIKIIENNVIDNKFEIEKTEGIEVISDKEMDEKNWGSKAIPDEQAENEVAASDTLEGMKDVDAII